MPEVWFYVDVFDQYGEFVFTRGRFKTSGDAIAFSNEPHFKYWLDEYGCFTRLKCEVIVDGFTVNNYIY